jgi:hypothetical protein
MEIAEFERELEVGFEDVFNRDRWGKRHLLGVAKLREQYVRLALQAILRKPGDVDHRSRPFILG